MQMYPILLTNQWQKFISLVWTDNYTGNSVSEGSPTEYPVDRPEKLVDMLVIRR